MRLREPTIAVALASAATAAWADAPRLPASAAWRVEGSPLEITAGAGFGGAVSSLRWRGREFLDASDHGRLLQGALAFGSEGECLNPTLAGASRDPAGVSTSRLLALRLDGRSLESATRMAFWHHGGEVCQTARGPKARAANADPLSDVVYRQRMTPNFEGRSGAVLDEITLVAAAAHAPATVEALTAYTPAAFSVLYALAPDAGRFVRDDDLRTGPAERTTPLILALPDGSAALGVVSLDAAPHHYEGRYLGAVNKWNVVYAPQGPFTAGAHAYRCVWAIGTLAQVEATLTAVTAHDAPRAAPPLTLLALGAAFAGVLAVWRRRRSRSGLSPLGVRRP